MKNKSLSSIIVLMLLTVISSKAQIVEECGTTATSTEMPLISQGDGIYLTANGTLRVLVVFVRFSDDNSASNHWPAAGFPSLADTFIDPTTTTVNSANYHNITNYFKEMSLGKFKVIGDVVKVVSPYASNDSRYSGLSGNSFRRKANQDVLEYIDNNTSINFSDYDNWTRNSNYNHSNSPDGVVDMIFMIWKGTWFSSQWRGEASMGYGTGDLLVDNGNTTIKFGFVSNGSGVTIHDNTNSTYLLNTVKHELGHWILGGGHPYGSSSNRHRISSILQSGEPFGLSVSASERERLGWITVPEISTNSSVTLDDFITTGDAYKYMIPGGSSNEYYYMTNHQNISMYDDATHEGSDKGIFILHDQNSISNTSNNRYVLSDGDWNWDHIGQVVNPWGDGTTYIPLFEREDVNRNGENFSKQKNTFGFGYSWMYALYDPIEGDTTIATHFRGTNLKSTYSRNSRSFFSEVTNPKPKSWVGTDIPFAFKVISQQGNELTLDFYTNYDPYTITENTTWDGQIFLDNTVTVQAGAKLTIKPNTTVYVADYESIHIYGELEVDRSTFTAMNNNWYGITFMSGSDGDIRESVIEEVQSFGGAAIRVHTNNHFEIQGNIIQNLYGAASGISLNNADNTYIYDNHIENTTNYGIYAYNSNARIFNNFIKNYSTAGVYSGGYSSVVLSGVTLYYYEGKNTIIGGKYGLQIGNQSYLNAGDSPSFASQNRIMNQNGSGWAHVYSTSAYSNSIRYNYYKPYNGSGGIAPIVGGSGSLSFIPWLSSDPNPGAGFKQVVNTGQNSETEDERLLGEAINHRIYKRYIEAEQLLNQLIADSNEKHVVDQALFEYAWVTQLSGNEEYLKRFEKLEKKYNTSSHEIDSKVLLAKVYHSKKDYAKALVLLDEVILKFPETEDTQQALILASYIAAEMGDEQRAYRYLERASTAKSKAVDSDGTLLELKHYLETRDFSISVVDGMVEDIESSFPSAIELTNYPNPFNPETVIKFTLPEKGKVSVKVYDLLGREVAVLVNGVQEQGSHSVSFNGASFASGIYIYRLQAGDQVITKRMTLIK